MNGFFDMVLSQLEAGLEGLKTEPNLIHRLDGSIKLVKKAISGLKAELRRYPFVGREEEIFYFRDQAPIIYSRLFYFLKIRLLEAHRRNLGPGERTGGGGKLDVPDRGFLRAAPAIAAVDLRG